MAKKLISEICYVYWLFDETCSVPENDGYVGITNNPKMRLRSHRSRLMRWTDVKILFVGTREECLVKEIGYRPQPNIGWNTQSGGTIGKVTSESTKRKIGQCQIGRTLPESQRKNMRGWLMQIGHQKKRFDWRNYTGS